MRGGERYQPAAVLLPGQAVRGARRGDRGADGDEPPRAVVPQPERAAFAAFRIALGARAGYRRVSKNRERNKRERNERVSAVSAVPRGNVRPDHLRRAVFRGRHVTQKPADLERVAPRVCDRAARAAVAHRAERRRASKSRRVHGVQHVQFQPGGERSRGGGARGEVRRRGGDRGRERPRSRLATPGRDDHLEGAHRGGRGRDDGVENVRRHA